MPGIPNTSITPNISIISGIQFPAAINGANHSMQQTDFFSLIFLAVVDVVSILDIIDLTRSSPRFGEPR